MFCENSCRVMQGMRVCVCVFPVSSVTQPVNRHLWAAGHLARAHLPDREERNCRLPHIHKPRSCMHAPTSSTSPHTDMQTSINTQIHSTTHSHTNTYPSAPTGDRHCHVYWLAGNLHRKERETSVYHSASLSSLFQTFFSSLGHRYINTLVSLFVQGNNSAGFIALQI